MRDHSFSGGGPVSVINFLTELKRAAESFRIHKGVVVWIFQEFMTDLAIVAIKAHFIVPSYDVSTGRESLNLF